MVSHVNKVTTCSVCVFCVFLIRKMTSQFNQRHKKMNKMISYYLIVFSDWNIRYRIPICFCISYAIRFNTVFELILGVIYIVIKYCHVKGSSVISFLLIHHKFLLLKVTKPFTCSSERQMSYGETNNFPFNILDDGFVI